MTTLPLEGIRIADFGQIIAVPYTAQMLAWLGAEVILIESRERLTTRIWPPFADNEPGVNRSGGFNTVNSSKMSCTLNLRDHEGVALAKQIISLSDIVVENYSSGTMKRMGLGYEAAKLLRPDVIYLSLGAFGRTGPMKDLVGFHSVKTCLAGWRRSQGTKVHTLGSWAGYSLTPAAVLIAYFPCWKRYIIG